MKFVNTNLITLKLVLFLFFGAIGCLFPFIPLHMTTKGLSTEESKIISIYTPLIAIIGPIIAGILADRFAGSFGVPTKTKTGTYLRIFIAISIILAAIFYSILAAIPPAVKRPPSVSFVCDQSGSFILQQRCGSENTCYNWNRDTEGSIFVTNCKFVCNATTNWTNVNYNPNDVTTAVPEPESVSEEDDYNDEGISDNAYRPEYPEKADFTDTTQNQQINLANIEPLPHLCYKDRNLCEAYTRYKPIELRLALNPHTENGERNVDGENICTYVTATPLQCRITEETIRTLTEETEFCHPVVKCDIYEAYSSQSMLHVSECGYDNISFYLYLLVKSLGDIFAAAAVALIGAAVVIATRETSTGRGDVGKQFAAGSLGLAIFAPIIGILAKGHFMIAILSYCVLSVLAALILLFDYKMPLSPPEWWWHTKCGVLALPMSSVKKYRLETSALILVLFLLGVFWSALDSYLPLHIVQLNGSTTIIGLTITVGSLPAVVYLYFAERIVDYCGHSNILILCFTSYIVHYAGLYFIETPDVLLIVEILEIFTLHLMWVTAVTYLRHLIPRKFTACGQALPVVAHFCLGRFIGSLLGGIGYTGRPADLREIYSYFAISAAVIAVAYFLLYHFYLKPRCAAPLHLPPSPSPAIVQSLNGNSSYTPLKVYHNGRAKKGQFRY